jgi:hypothetical protein
MLTLRQRLIDLGMTGYVEQQQILQEVTWWLSEKCKVTKEAKIKPVDKITEMAEFARQVRLNLYKELIKDLDSPVNGKVVSNGEKQ